MPEVWGLRSASEAVQQLRALQQRPWAAILRACIRETAAISIQLWWRGLPWRLPWRERCLALLQQGLLGVRRVLGLLHRRAAIRIQQWWRGLHANGVATGGD